MLEAGNLPRPALRRQLRQARRNLSPQQQKRAARDLYRQLAQHPLFRRCRHIALYLPNDGEIDPRPLLRAAQRRGKATYLPVLKRWPRTKMSFQRVHPHESMTRNRFRIAEPQDLPARQREVGYVFQDFALFPHLTLAQNVAFGLRMQKATQQLGNTNTLRTTRRDIARAKTILAEKQAAK